MSLYVSVQNATIQLSWLIDQAVAGRQVVLVEAGRPVARLLALAAPSGPKRLGLLKGKFSVPEDFTAPLNFHSALLTCK